MARKKKLTEEEILTQKLVRQKERLIGELDKLRTETVINTPSRILKIGDRVEYGNWDSAIIEEVLDDGKIYLINAETKDIQYGKYIGQKINKQYNAWHDVLPYRTNEESTKQKSMFLERYIDFRNNNVSLHSMIHYYYKGVDLSPDYQRGNVWTLKQDTALIDSIFNRISIGQFSIIEKPFEAGWPWYEILDGKQRLSAIINFIEDRFQYKGKFFSELSRRDQRGFENVTVGLNITSEEITQEQKYEYFLRLNTQGSPQDPEHINYVKTLLKSEKKND